MPTFTALALDRLIEPRASNSMAPVRNAAPDARLERTRSTPNSRSHTVSAPGSKVERGVSVPPRPELEQGLDVYPNPKLARGASLPPNPRLDKRNGAPNTAVIERKHHWTQISPALYATPDSTPLPDTPSSYPPSPYIVNHKRRGPRLLKSFSEEDVATHEHVMDENAVEENGKNEDKAVATVAKNDDCAPRDLSGSPNENTFTFSFHTEAKNENANILYLDDFRGSNSANNLTGQEDTESFTFNLQRDGETDDFFDPQDSMSVTSNSETEGNGGAERPLNPNPTTPAAEFYDAWEDLSSENTPQPPVHDIEAELREIRSNLSREIEKRKQTEDILNNVRNNWQTICKQLSSVGLTLPEDPTAASDGRFYHVAEDFCQQLYLARFVSNSIGRGTAKAEVEMEMEAQIESKNFEIARLWDRLRYYEAVNREMSQRNQEAIETTRRLRQKRKRRQKWLWGSIATMITLGSAVLAFSYIQAGKASSSSSQSPPEVDHKPKQ